MLPCLLKVFRNRNVPYDCYLTTCLHFYTNNKYYIKMSQTANIQCQPFFHTYFLIIFKNKTATNNKRIFYNLTLNLIQSNFYLYTNTQVCEPIPCPKTEECPSPYDEAITEITECGCTKLIECRKLRFNIFCLRNQGRRNLNGPQMVQYLMHLFIETKIQPIFCLK